MKGTRQGVTKTYRRIQGFHEGKQRFCAYDRHPFDCDETGVPIVVPIVDRFDTEKNVYMSYRGACSASCAKSYILDQRGSDTHLRLMWQRQMMIDHGMWAHDKPIPVARSWEEIDGNLGSVPIEEWRQSAGSVRTSIRPSHTVPYDVFIEEECEVDVDDEEDDALGSFNLHGLARPPDEQNIKTKEEFLAKYPGHISDDPGAFQRWLDKNEGSLPTDEECERVYSDFKAARKDERKRKAEQKEVAVPKTSSRRKKPQTEVI